MNPKFCGGDAGITLAPAEEMKAGSDQKVEQPRPPIQAFRAGTRLHPGTLAATKDALPVGPGALFLTKPQDFPKTLMPETVHS